MSASCALLYGLIILNTTQSDPLNKAIADRTQYVLKFKELSEADSLNVLGAFLSQTALADNERGSVLETVKSISTGQRLSGRQILNIIGGAISTCEAQRRDLQPADIIRAFAIASNLEYELNLIESDHIYTADLCETDPALDL
ncbi:hypothetical protein NA56DRAFT_706424 [Hyaloscypha hepaticicola]|uniref:Uncharacterized protein n=1 Tax=Hyaloscypha hepaticicola TaxID=2082293 RepID=A0A2J6PXX8_9HELO|nr:hypothetical protein NA56DRAFT_706424 [Hyaloscypha hepaticicola]